MYTHSDEHLRGVLRRLVLDYPLVYWAWHFVLQAALSSHVEQDDENDEQQGESWNVDGRELFHFEHYGPERRQLSENRRRNCSRNFAPKLLPGMASRE